jgi:hypothetical protein
MNVSRFKQTLPQKGGVGLGMMFVKIFQDVSTPNLIRALAAILLWSLLIGAISLYYELWRLARTWRLGIA